MNFFYGLVLGTLLGVFMIGTVVEHRWQSWAISEGYALYCPTNGVFALVEECEENH